MRRGVLADPRRDAQQRRARLERETAEIERANQAKRSGLQQAAVAERAERDRLVRQRAHELNTQLAEARRAAEDAETDFSSGCARLAAGQATFEEAQALQRERDAARRAREIFEQAVGLVRSDPALVGRR